MRKHEPKADPALTELCSRRDQPLRRYLQHRGVTRSSDIDDVAQEAFLRLLCYGPGIEIRDPLAYLYRIACNVANEWHERSVNRKPHVSEQELEQAKSNEEACPEGIVEREEREHMVRAAIERLPPRVRQVIQLHVYAGLTYPQVAEQLGISYRMVLRDLVRAHAELHGTTGVLAQHVAHSHAILNGWAAPSCGAVASL